MIQKTYLKPAEVSVIIPCYSCSDTLARAVASVANQTMLPKEIILIDDASHDNGKTLNVIDAVIKDYSAVFNIKIIKFDENKGAASARNAGWNAAIETYIAFLDADDAWHPQKLEMQYFLMRQNESVCLSGNIYSEIDKVENFKCNKLLSNVDFIKLKKIKALLSNPFSTSTVMLKRDINFRFKEGARHTEDYLLWLQIITSGLDTIYIKSILAAIFKSHYGRGGLSANLWMMQKGEINAYLTIYKSSNISLFTLVVCVSYSLLKYLRRLFIVGFRLLVKK